MKIEFVYRTPGQRNPNPIVELDACPRKGELVTFNGDTSHEVHEVTHDVGRGVVSVLLKL